MRETVSVPGVPPKKDGANSMWGKPAEVPRLKALRAAVRAKVTSPIAGSKRVTLRLRVLADSSAGDLDNFITGICDGLMAADPRARIDPEQWLDVPVEIRPDRPIAFVDDGIVAVIEAERLALEDTAGERYDLELEW